MLREARAPPRAALALALILLTGSLSLLAGGPSTARSLGAPDPVHQPTGCELLADCHAWALDHAVADGGGGPHAVAARDGTAVHLAGPTPSQGAFNLTLRSLDPATGQMRWQTEHRIEGSSRLKVAELLLDGPGQRLYALATTWEPELGARGLVVAAEASTGTVLWSLPVASSGATEVLGGQLGPLGQRLALRTNTPGGSGAAVVDLEQASLLASVHVPGLDQDRGLGALALDPLGSTVYLAGTARGQEGRPVAWLGAWQVGSPSPLWTWTAAGYEPALWPGALVARADGERLYVVSTTKTRGMGLAAVVSTLDEDSGQTVAEHVLTFGDPANERVVQALEVPGSDRLLLVMTKAGLDGSGHDVLTAAVEPASGEVAWSRTYAAPVGGWDQPHLARLSPEGDRLVVAASGWGRPGLGANGGDLLTPSYEVASGQLVSVERFDGGSQRALVPSGLAVSAGHVVVAGGDGQGQASVVGYAR